MSDNQNNHPSYGSHHSPRPEFRTDFDSPSYGSHHPPRTDFDPPPSLAPVPSYGSHHPPRPEFRTNFDPPPSLASAPSLAPAPLYGSHHPPRPEFRTNFDPPPSLVPAPSLAPAPSYGSYRPPQPEFRTPFDPPPLLPDPPPPIEPIVYERPLDILRDPSWWAPVPAASGHATKPNDPFAYNPPQDPGVAHYVPPRDILAPYGAPPTHEARHCGWFFREYFSNLTGPNLVSVIKRMWRCDDNDVLPSDIQPRIKLRDSQNGQPKYATTAEFDRNRLPIDEWDMDLLAAMGSFSMAFKGHYEDGVKVLRAIVRERQVNGVVRLANVREVMVTDVQKYLELLCQDEESEPRSGYSSRYPRPQTTTEGENRTA